MNLVEVDVVGIEALERIFAGTNDVQARVTVVVRAELRRIVDAKPRPSLAVVDLGGNQHLVAFAEFLDGLADNLLARPIGVGVARIHQVDTGIEAHFQNARRLLGRRRIHEVVGAQSQRRDLNAGTAENAIIHVAVLPDIKMYIIYEKGILHRKQYTGT